MLLNCSASKYLPGFIAIRNAQAGWAPLFWGQKWKIRVIVAEHRNIFAGELSVESE